MIIHWPFFPNFDEGEGTKYSKFLDTTAIAICHWRCHRGSLDNEDGGEADVVADDYQVGEDCLAVAKTINLQPRWGGGHLNTKLKQFCEKG